MLLELNECNFDLNITVIVGCDIHFTIAFGICYLPSSFLSMIHLFLQCKISDYVDNIIDNIVLVECLFIELFEHI